jgi:hypothetical protein
VIKITGQEAGLFEAATGEKPPEFNEDLGREAGQRLQVMGDLVNGLIPMVHGVRMRGMDGGMPRAFGNMLDQYTVSPPYILPMVSGLARELGAFAITTSDQTESMKIQAIALLATMITLFIVTLIITYYTGDPEAFKYLSGVWLTVRVTLEALLDGLLMRILQMGVIGILIQVFTDILAQAIAVAEGIQRDWNWSETVFMAGAGALGGAMGAFLMPLQGRLTGELAHVFGSLLTRAGIGDLGKVLGEDLSRELGEDLGKGLGEGLGSELDKGLVKDLGGELGGGPGRGAGPSWASERLPAGSAAWWLHNMAEFFVAIVIGGFHNAAHFSLWQLITTGQVTWSWAAFMGGSAQGVMHPVAVMTGGGLRMVVGVTAPVENLIAATFGEVTPEHLADIAAAEPAGGFPGSGSGGGEGGGGLVPGLAGGGEEGPLLVPPEFAGEGPVSAGTGPVDEPVVVRMMRALDVPVGPEAAYSIAVRTGMVPVAGPVTGHRLYDNPMTVTLPAFTSVSDMAARVRDTIAANPGRPLAEIMVEPAQPHDLAATAAYEPLPPAGSHEAVSSSLLDEPLPAGADQFPVLAPEVLSGGLGLPPAGSHEAVSSSLLDEPLPAGADQFPVLAPRVLSRWPECPAAG